MILIDHLLIGTAVGLSLSDDPVIIGITVLGSIMPDFDGIFARPGTVNYLIKHRTVTHSLFLSPIYAIIIAIVLKFIFYDQALLVLWLFALMGIISHLIVDTFNSFGTMLFYPFNKKKIVLDLIYEFDPIISLLFLIMSIEFFLLGEKITFWILVLNAFSIGVYYLLRVLSKNNFKDQLKKQFPYIINNTDKITIVPAKYWRWKGIAVLNDTHIVFRKIEKKIVIDDRPIHDIPEELVRPKIKKYIEYARVLDVSITDKELVLQNLIYSASVYTLRMNTDSSIGNNITISLPNLKYDDY